MKTLRFRVGSVGLLTTEAIVAEVPEKDGGGMPGGMPDMGGMM